MGIGGYKPFPAEFTDNKKYGDCKGLSFYTYSILKLLGIKSYVALVNAEFNNEPVDPAFPCNQFNHVILCIPQPKDTIWLECTSKTNDFGILGAFTENRNALLITDDGGILVATPKSTSSENKSDVITKVVLKDDGSGTTSTLLRSTGDFKEIMNSIIDEKKDDQKESIVFYMGFKQPDEFIITKEDEPGSITAIDLAIEKIPEFIAGNKMFLSPRIYKIWTTKLPKSVNRKQDYYFQCPFEKTDTAVYILPAGYKQNAFPQAKEIKCDFGSYSTKYWYDTERNAIFSIASFVLIQNKIPAGKYASVKKFFDEILLDDTQKIVIKKD